MTKLIQLLKREIITYKVNFNGDSMAFIKHGDGKILSVVKEEELTEDQKKALKEASLLAEQSEQLQINNSNKKIKN